MGLLDKKGGNNTLPGLPQSPYEPFPITEGLGLQSYSSLSKFEQDVIFELKALREMQEKILDKVIKLGIAKVEFSEPTLELYSNDDVVKNLKGAGLLNESHLKDYEIT